MPLHVEAEPLGTAQAENVPDGFNTLTTLTTVRITCITHAVCFERACVNAVVQSSQNQGFGCTLVVFLSRPFVRTIEAATFDTLGLS